MSEHRSVPRAGGGGSGAGGNGAGGNGPTNIGASDNGGSDNGVGENGASGRTRRRLLRGIGGAATAGLVGVAGCIGTGSGSGSSTATVFHAGSLAPPFSDAEPTFEKETGIDVQREAKGSVGSTKKITEQGRRAEVLGVSDFRLIRDMLLPEYGEWYAIFATNAMAIAYTDESKYADEFGTDTWWDVLSREDVTVAHSDPAVDPNGYRSVMAMQLGAIEFEGERLYGPDTRDALLDNARVGAGTETDLLSQLEAGELDYAWEYRSAGVAHDSLNVVGLQPHVNLAKATDAYARHYAKATVQAGGDTYTGAPIAYGITVPSVARNPEAGARWVEYFATEPGRQVMTENGFTTVSPVVVPASGEGAVPDRVRSHASAKSKLGPLDL